MEHLCITSLSSPQYRKSTYKRTVSYNQPFILNSASFHDRLKGNIAHSFHQKMPLAISKRNHPPSPLLCNKMICKCQSKEQPVWPDTSIPKTLRPYFMLTRLERDIGFWLTVWPTYWSIALATNPGAIPDIKYMALLGCISLLICTSGCTVDELHDIEFDKQVERCKKRPLASGELSPLQGWCFWGFQILLLTPFLLQLNKISLGIAVAQHILIFLYPLMKRVTYLPSAFLGVTLNWSGLVGWTAVTGSMVNINNFLPVFISGVFWTIIHDTIYSHMDKKDDVKAGVKSSALLFGSSTTYWNIGFWAVCIGSLVLGGYNAHLGWPFYPFIAAAAGQLLWQILTVDLSDPTDIYEKFVSNKWFGALVFTGIVLGRLLS